MSNYSYENPSRDLNGGFEDNSIAKPFKPPNERSP
jgi:hypothetical protein